MARLISCLGFWVTIGLFIAFGYALGDDCMPPCTYIHSFALDPGVTSEAICAADEAGCEASSSEDFIPRASRLDLAESMDRVGAKPVSAPSIVLTWSDNPLCFGVRPCAVQTWR